MVKELQNIFENDLVKQLIAQSVETGQAVSINAPEMTIKIIPTENSFSIQIEYNANKEAANFKDWVSKLPDQLFADICEYLGGDNINEIALNLESSDVNNVRIGISTFKKAAKEYCLQQIDKYQTIIKTI